MNKILILAILAGLFTTITLLIIIVCVKYCDKILLRWYKAEPLNDVIISEIVQTLALDAGLRPPKTYLTHSDMANIFTVGKSEKQGSIVFTTALLELLEPEELKSVVAHELYHVQTGLRRRSLVALFAGAVASVATLAFWSSLLLGFGAEDDPAPRLIKKFAASVVAPHASMITNLTIKSKKSESEADRYSARLCGESENLKHAIEKTGVTKYAANPGHAHLYFVNPLPKETFNSLFETHPTVETRKNSLHGAEI